MNIQENHPPRSFQVGHTDHPITLYDCAHLRLAADEQITLLGPTGSEVDITRKNWGYYGMSSLNSRLPRFGLLPALVRNTQDNKYFILLVEPEQNAAFEHYLQQTHQELICWLHDDEVLARISAAARMS